MYTVLNNNSLVSDIVPSRYSAIAEDIENSVKAWPSN